jgi:acyl-CoA hydrolase
VAAQTPQQQYLTKLTKPEKAVEPIANGSTLCIALGVGMPSGLAKAFADRVLSGNLKNLNLYYQHSMKYAAETFARPEVLAKVDARNFFIGEQIDLYGQVNAEFIDGHQYSGSGGQFDFVKGAAFSKGGKSFIGLKSAAKRNTISCIVPRVQMATDTRMDVEHIVTEYGCVNLRGKSTKARAELLISIAHPDFRGELKRHAKSINLI